MRCELVYDTITFPRWRILLNTLPVPHNFNFRLQVEGNCKKLSMPKEIIQNITTYTTNGQGKLEVIVMECHGMSWKMIYCPHREP